MNILINTTNLHFGGGVQVASSFISELASILKDSSGKYNISLLYSTLVKSNINADCDLSLFNFSKELNVYGIKQPSKGNKKLFDGYDVCFTVFGPMYFKPNVKKHICGFAQPWIAYPKNDAYPKLTLVNWLKNKLRFSIQNYLYKQYDKLVVEQQNVKDALVNLGYNKDKINVVSNSVSTLYDTPQSWKPIDLNELQLKHNITLGFLGRAYPHKNVNILIEVSKLLAEEYNFTCNFVFTFTHDEMKVSGFYELDNFFTVGPITVYQCPAFYQLLDGLIFPSLLECFSASPIEAMKMNTTVFASNYPFITEICQNAAIYFDALDARSIAESIVTTFADESLMEEKRTLGSTLVRYLPTAKDRAIAFLNIINK